MRHVWVAVGSLLAVAALGWGTYSTVSLLAHEEQDARHAFPAEAVSGLEVRNDDGTVEVTGRDVDEVTVEVHVDHGLRRTSERAELRDGTLVLRGDCPTGPSVWCSVDYRIVVPRDLPVEVESANGRITLRDLDAEVVVAGSNGRIELARITGPTLDARTSNGPIEGRGLSPDTATLRTSNGPIEAAFAEPPRVVTATTSNGPVELVLPDDRTTYQVDVRAGHLGSTDVAVRTDPSSDRTLYARTSNGSVTVRYPTG